MCGHWVYMIIITVTSHVYHSRQEPMKKVRGHGLLLTYDDQYLLTGAGNGNVFVYKTIL